MKSDHLLLSATVLVLIALCVAGQHISLPTRPLGFVYGGGASRSAVEVAVYLDPTCPDSKQVYPTLLQVADRYEAANVQLRMYLFPLPYLRNSHTISKAARVLDGYTSSKAGRNTVFQWINTTFSQIDKLSPSATAKLNDEQVMEILTPLATQLTGIPIADFVNGVKDRTIDVATRLEWKYGCTRGVYGTPMFTINDVFVAADSWTLDQWGATLDRLLSA